MQEDLRKRRDETFEMLVVKGYDYRRVVDTLADRYDVATGTIESDINRMDDWLPRLVHYDDDDGQGRLLELRKNRQRLHQMATEARQEDDHHLELKIRRQIDSSVDTEVELAQSLGQMTETADTLELDGVDTLANFTNDAED
jgi:hypothetical protein